MTQPSPSDLEALKRLVGEQIDQVQVLSANALKTVFPPLATLCNQRVLEAGFSDSRRISLVTSAATIGINLERTGRASWHESASPWTPGQPAAPTIRILTLGGSALDLTEPARTKRITISLFAL